MPCMDGGPSHPDDAEFYRLCDFLREIGLSLQPNLTTRRAGQLLCEFFKASGADPARYSLELQIWWRDHQRADAAREAREAEALKKLALRRQALAKLTPEERKALGL